MGKKRKKTRKASSVPQETLRMHLHRKLLGREPIERARTDASILESLQGSCRVSPPEAQLLLARAFERYQGDPAVLARHPAYPNMCFLVEEVKEMNAAAAAPPPKPRRPKPTKPKPKLQPKPKRPASKPKEKVFDPASLGFELARGPAAEVPRLQLSTALHAYLQGRPGNSPHRRSLPVRAMLSQVFGVDEAGANELINRAVQVEDFEARLLARIPGYNGNPPKDRYFHRNEFHIFDPDGHVPLYPGHVELARTHEIRACLMWRMPAIASEEELLKILCGYFGVGKSGDYEQARPLLEKALEPDVALLIYDGKYLLMNPDSPFV